MTRFAKSTLIMISALFTSAIAAHAQTAGGRIQGTIADSLHGGPLVGALVVAIPDATLRDTVFHSAQTDRLGHFVLGNLRAGAYSVSVEHPVIDSTGIGVPFTAVTVSDAQTAETFLAIPSVASLRRALCSVAVQDTLLGVMLGTVRRANGEPVPNATLVVLWSDFDVDKTTARVQTRQLSATVKTDASGNYRACGLPVQRSLFVQAQGESKRQSGVVEEQIGSTGVLLRDYHIGGEVLAATRAAATDAATPAATFTLVGKVTTLAGKAIASAQVSLLGALHVATSNDDGEFRLSGVTAGSQGLYVIALGYYPQIQRVEVGSGDAPVVVKMENAAVVLDSMRVIAKRSGPRLSLAHREFEHRRESSIGTFLDQKQIAAMHPMTVIDIVRHLPGIRIATPNGPSSEIIVSNRGTVSFSGGPSVCPMDVYLDGIRIAGGSDPQGATRAASAVSEINIVPPETLYGIEVHSVATAPVKYKVSNCGAVFFWTR